ncbi:hypothetical protein TWF694_006372 [Orbilia ellipsospora]|uniref:Uncharacterized protein n=1 Tax=Orbilia ellipsospora TaxID=2528407 RepID=A0AAV9XK09_9PEZI
MIVIPKTLLESVEPAELSISIPGSFDRPDSLLEMAHHDSPTADFIPDSPITTITIINPTPHPLQAIKNNQAWVSLQDPISPNSDGVLVLDSQNTGKAAYILGETGDVIEVAGGRGDPMVKLCPEVGGGDNAYLQGVMKEPGHYVYTLPELINVGDHGNDY